MRTPAPVALFLPLALTGCALSNTATPSPEEPVTGAAIQGVVHGGQQPVGGAHVYLFAAGTSGYGGNGIAASSSNASVSVFTSAETGQSDSVGPYITTTSNGNFTFPSYTCTPGTQLYIYVLGGNPGNGTNSALGLMAALGNCPAAGNVNTTVPYISINEITTVAAAYALAGFATEATHIGSSGTALAQTGIANAFLNATNLANIATGAALATTPSGNGTVPHDEIVTLADILAYCVNSNDLNSTISSNCSTLFGYTLSGGTTGSTPTDTASSAINIAHNPGANVSNIFPLVPPKPPYATNGAYSQPNDFTIALAFSDSSLNGPRTISVDAQSNIWTPNIGGSSVTELGVLGNVLSPSGGFTGGNLNGPCALAIDLQGDAWVANDNIRNITEITPSGTVTSFKDSLPRVSLSIAVDASDNIWIGHTSTYGIGELVASGGTWTAAGPFTGGGLNGPWGIAIDTSGDVWASNVAGDVVSEFTNAGTPITTSAGYATGGDLGIAIDASGYIWVAVTNGGEVIKLNSGGGVVGTYAASNIVGPVGLAIDGAGNAWVVNGSANNIAEISSAGAFLSPSAGYIASSFNVPHGVGVDGSGNVWVANTGADTVIELVGVAAPVVTPLVVGVKNNTLGTRP